MDVMLACDFGVPVLQQIRSPSITKSSGWLM